MAQIDLFFNQVNNWIWGLPLLFLFLGTGLYLTWILRGLQFRYLIYAFRQIYAEQKNSTGDINPYEALMTTLAGAIGTGAIVGVSTAVVVGGVGALFWMWVTAILGMATKYAESLLAIKYRKTDVKGEMIGGPMEYIEKGLNMKWLAMLFAFLAMIAVFGTGNLVQVNSIADALNSVTGLDPWIAGIILAILTACVILGGIQSVGRVAGILVPFMAVMYVGAGIYILCVYHVNIPAAFVQIFKEALDFSSLAGGVMGSAFMLAVQTGVSRSVLSNEAGLGISSIASAAARTDSPGRQALINMTGALISTLVICTITGLVLMVTGALDVLGENGARLRGVSLAIQAFNTALPGGEYIVTLGLILFAFTTVLAWAYYGEKCCEYVFGEKAIFIYRAIFCLVIIPGAALKMELAWCLADVCNGIMAIPNLIALVALSPIIVKETHDFLRTVSEETITAQPNL